MSSLFAPAIQLSVSTSRASAPDHLTPGLACCTVDSGGGAQSDALAALASLASASANARNLVNQNGLGPYGADGSCNFDCGFKTQHWGWSVDYRNSVNANLIQYVNAADFNSVYRSGFQPAQGWVGQGLPGLSATVTSTVASIMSIDAAIAASGQESPQQAAQLNAGFAALAGAIDNNKGQISRAMQSILSCLQWSEGQPPRLAAYVVDSKASIKDGATSAENNLIAQIACGDGDVRNSFNNMFNDVDARYTAMQPGFSNVAATAQTALTACQRVGGQFLPWQADTASSGAEFAQAQPLQPGSFIRRLHLRNAADLWAQMAQSATFQLASS